MKEPGKEATCHHRIVINFKNLACQLCSLSTRQYYFFKTSVLPLPRTNSLVKRHDVKPLYADGKPYKQAKTQLVI